ncbi:sulfate permease [Gottschalkiaceae bacterium SANA]|nr:sulfate permease [Gottschalkiaceae bacterium SANA]
MSQFKPKLFSTMQKYTKEQLIADCTSGVIVAIIALPLSIALAIASGVTPEKGLHTAIIAGFLISLLGGSRVQIGGPTGAFMVIVYGIVMEFGIDGLIISTIMAGLMMILMGVLRLGNMIKFIPYPITTGFTSGIALVIFSSQMKDLFGLQIAEVPVEFIGKWQAYFGAAGSLDWTTMGIGLLALLIIIGWPKVNQKVPGAFVALVVTSVIVQIFHLDIATIGSKFGVLSSSLPSLQVPELSVDKIRLLVGPAFTIAILGSMESLLSAVVSDGMIGGKHRSNMELIAQGVANIASGLFGGIPATGAIARTVANIKNGGRTPVAGMVHALVLLLILVLFMPLAQMVPLTTLAAILIMVAVNMSEWREFQAILKTPKSDVLVLLTTFSITVLVDLVQAIEVGIVLAAFLFVKRMADVSEVQIGTIDAAEELDGEDGSSYEKSSERRKIAPGIQVYEINGPFFFGAADKFIEALNGLGYHTDGLIIGMKNVPAMDATALHAFKRMLKMCEAHHIEVFVSGLGPQPMQVLKRAGIMDLMGEERFFTDLDDALLHAKVQLPKAC